METQVLTHLLAVVTTGSFQQLNQLLLLMMEPNFASSFGNKLC